MLRNYIIPIILFSGSAIFWFLNDFLEDPIYFRIFLSLLLMGTIFCGYKIITEIIAKKVIKDRKTQFTFNKGILIISAAIFLVLIIQIWVENTESLVISYGILAAGIAIALQDLFRNFVGGIIIALTSIYKIGDRIEVEGSIGDIMDIGILNTTMMEIKGWIDAEQPTGRLIILPNSIVISGRIFNYTKDHEFIWDEIRIPLTYESDWKAAINNFLEIVKAETGEITLQAEIEVERLGEKYYLPKKVTEPAVYVKLTDNWVELGIRYVTNTKTRRILSDILNRKILEDVAAAKTYSIASESMEIQGRHTVELLRS
ncbi:mechanosensitive ion channel family protein [Methanogenium sp. S4BF]|uniref:mechanosensitive ion channel family protein n=1 Tax=Methanogenium sp. S4BF TaxID=1789226 RepID=UPI00241729BD|nr:mechanosensitive ion channel domain-containing protein [Methanogenium sp. S4BF]WFN35106.1 mechanosensitive ion channel family protein [Methanogenium sp. S4BF]